MTILNKISLFQFRNYSQEAFQLDNSVTCITGANGSGKTNFLDAVYYLCYTKSYFSASVQQSAQHNTDGFRIEGIFSKNERLETIVCKYKNAKKEVSAGNVLYEKMSDHIGKFTAVMIAPDDIELINDGSELRRKFMDSILGQSDSNYLESLLQYQRVLLQRNAWLKMYAFQTVQDYSFLDYYNAQLQQYGGYIFECRQQFVQQFLPLLVKYYQLLSGAKEVAGLVYQSDLHTKKLSVWLDDSLPNDFRYQRTLRGIHKDELSFLLDGISIKNFGSQGQKKSYLFALKLAQYEYVSQVLGSSPILLLDDIFEKLDQQRMEALLHIISANHFGQVILTDTHENRVRAAFGAEKEIGFIRL